MRLFGETAHEVLSVPRLTMAENPFRAFTVKVEAPAKPARIVTVAGAAVIEKSDPELKTTVAV